MSNFIYKKNPPLAHLVKHHDGAAGDRLLVSGDRFVAKAAKDRVGQRGHSHRLIVSHPFVAFPPPNRVVRPAARLNLQQKDGNNR